MSPGTERSHGGDFAYSRHPDVLWQRWGSSVMEPCIRPFVPLTDVVVNQPATFSFPFPYGLLYVFFFGVSNLPGTHSWGEASLSYLGHLPGLQWNVFPFQNHKIKQKGREKRVTLGYFQYNFSFSSMPWCAILKNIMFLGWSVFSFNKTPGHSRWAQKLNVTSSVPCYLAENSGCMLFMSFFSPYLPSFIVRFQQKLVSNNYYIYTPQLMIVIV